jgi:murein DD-endopeptidase MepM/ murein hydrolase activator NlpD
MNIILVGKYRGQPLRCQIGNRWQMAVCGSIMASVLAGVCFTGYWLGKSEGVNNHLTELSDDLSQQKGLIETTRNTAQSELDALAARMGQMQAHVTRLNALGQRLIKIAKIDASEFDFDQLPAYGGPSDAENSTGSDFQNVLSELNEQLDSREQQLAILEDLIVNKQIQHEAKPAGRPITKGWISSYFGKRTDPFTGKKEMHKGMDFAGKAGSEVIAVANGVVTWSGPRYGYGNLVEINHGNGLTTRYGHNEDILVEVGDAVEKGQAISLMGSTGRSTGPHVHFEVLKNDHQIDPAKFVHANS